MFKRGNVQTKVKALGEIGFDNYNCLRIRTMRGTEITFKYKTEMTSKVICQRITKHNYERPEPLNIIPKRRLLYTSCLRHMFGCERLTGYFSKKIIPRVLQHGALVPPQFLIHVSKHHFIPLDEHPVKRIGDHSWKRIRWFEGHKTK